MKLNKASATYVELQPGTKVYRSTCKGDQVRDLESYMIGKVPPLNHEIAWDRYEDDQLPLGFSWLTANGWVYKRDAKVIKLITLPKTKRALLTTKSEWVVEKDMVAFYTEDLGVKPDCPWQYHHNYNTVYGIMPAGTHVKVLNAKAGQVSYDYTTENSIDVEINGQKATLPVRFMGGMECTKRGAIKTYWRLLDKNGEMVRKKRYKTLAAVKGAVRIITGQHTGEEINGDPENIDGPWWADGSASCVGYVHGDTPTEEFTGWVAVEYLAEDDSVKQKVDMGEHLFDYKMAKA